MEHCQRLFGWVSWQVIGVKLLCLIGELVWCVVCSGTLVAVGLKPTEDERRHWRLMEAYASELDKKAAPAKEETDGITAASIEAEPLPYTPSMLMRQVTKYSLRPEEKIRSVKSIQQNKGTGRHQAVNTNLKPDLWRVVYDSLKTRTKVP